MAPTDRLRLITAYAAAEMLGIHYETLGRWRREYRGPAYVRIPTDSGRGAVRYDVRAIEDWLEQHTIRGPEGGRAVQIQRRRA